MAIILFLLAYNLVVKYSFTDFYNSFYRTFDSFISLTETGKYESETLLELKSYILFPDLETFLFGSNDALLNYDIARNLDSDLGYVRNIFSFGFFGFLLYLFPFLMLILFALKKSKQYLEYKFLLILLIIMLIFHAKESYLYVRMFWSIICLVLGFILNEESNKKSSIRCVE